MNYRFISNTMGLMCLSVAGAMVPALICSLIFRESHATYAFTESAILCVVVGLVFMLLGRGASSTMYEREAIFLVGSSWLVAAGLGALPFLLDGALPNPVDAFFESMSGFTTTGSTVIADIEANSRSILFWRCFTQWLGGIGIVVLFLAVLPTLGAGGKQMLKLEVPGPIESSLKARVADSAKFVAGLYVGLTVTLTAILLLMDFDLYDALCHSFSTVSTGGFSPRQASIGAFQRPMLEVVIIVFMVISAINFTLYFDMLRGKRLAVMKDPEVRLYLAILAVATLLIAINIFRASSTGSVEPGVQSASGQVSHDSFPDALRSAAFQVASVSTTTGFLSESYDSWPELSKMLLLIIMLIGGCGGSTAGGFKAIRIILLAKMVYWRVEKTFRPKTIRAVRLGDTVIDEVIRIRLGGYFILYVFTMVAGSIVMSAFGLPFETAISSVVTTVNNVGPGLDLVGASSDFSQLPSLAKLILAMCMVVGRLELFAIYALLMPSFWLRN